MSRFILLSVLCLSLLSCSTKIHSFDEKNFNDAAPKIDNLSKSGLDIFDYTKQVFAPEYLSNNIHIDKDTGTIDFNLLGASKIMMENIITIYDKFCIAQGATFKGVIREYVKSKETILFFIPKTSYDYHITTLDCIGADNVTLFAAAFSVNPKNSNLITTLSILTTKAIERELSKIKSE